ICTSTWFRAGTATRISCRSWQTPACCPRISRPAPHACVRSSIACSARRTSTQRTRRTQRSGSDLFREICPFGFILCVHRVLCVDNSGDHLMNFEFTAEQLAFKEEVDRFAREIVAPRAAAIDKSGEYPGDVMHAAAGLGLLGVTIPEAWGGTGRDYIS